MPEPFAVVEPRSTCHSGLDQILRDSAASEEGTAKPRRRKNNCLYPPQTKQTSRPSTATDRPPGKLVPCQPPACHSGENVIDNGSHVKGAQLPTTLRLKAFKKIPYVFESRNRVLSAACIGED